MQGFFATRARRSSAVTPYAPYAELHCHSCYSFLDGASHPEGLTAEAARLGLEALAITDHDGLYGAVGFAAAGRSFGVPTVFGAEITLSPSGPRTGTPDPEGAHLVVIARDPDGYARLSRAISEAHLAGGVKGRPLFSLEDLSERHGGHWVVLTGCRKGAVPSALLDSGPRAAERALGALVDSFGRNNVLIELWDHGDPMDPARNDALATIGIRHGVEAVATNNVHYATPARHPVATVLAAVRAGRTLDRLDPWLPPAPTACLRSGAEQERRFSRWPGVVSRASETGLACAFDLGLVAPGLPDFPVPAGHTEQSWLTELVRRGARERYGERSCERVKGAWSQIDHELAVISELGYAGYFLVVWDIVELCRRKGIYCQGRGSAANSAVCYALGITRADAVALGLLFERFLSPERDGPPDIDVDIESGRREEVIAYVYERYGRHHAAQVASVITYRTRSAVRDVARALGHSPADASSWASATGGIAGRPEGLQGAAATSGGSPGMPEQVARLAAQVVGLPRHLGLHSGGMVICDRPVVEVCPVEWARHPGRSVLQWDKEDCAAVGLVKFDLLGLGMLEALHRAVDLVAKAHGIDLDLARIPQEDAVYEMLCRADTIGVFQVESRAQMATLPRVQPRCFGDLVVEVALVRPGPIQGGSVHPYIRRRQGREAPDPPHPLLGHALRKTLGVPLFQEQLMQVAIDAAGFSPAEADELRQAMSAKRSGERMERLRGRLLEGMAARGITGSAAAEIIAKLEGFANFGFPESHAVSFAYLVYASAWLKLHYPAAFYTALLNAQPMGFWSPQSLVSDARRHGVEVLRPHVEHSGADATLEWTRSTGREPPGDPDLGSLGDPDLGSPGDPDLGSPGDPPPQPAIRLGLSSVRSVGRDMAKAIERGKPYSSLEDLSRRSGTSRAQLESLAAAGALEGMQARDSSGAVLTSRRQALWAAGPVAQSREGHLPGMVFGDDPPELPDPETGWDTAADMWATGLTVGPVATQLARAHLDRLGVTPAAELAGEPHGSKVTVGGVVTHRQRPSSARGTVFLNIEDETGMVNVICSPGAWARWGQMAAGCSSLLVRGRLERVEGTMNVVAWKLAPLDLGGVPVPASRDFR